MNEQFESGSTGLRIYNAHDESGYREWMRAWRCSSRSSVFHHPDYVRLFATSDSIPCCAVFEVDGAPAIMYPFIERPIAYGTRNLADITSPYGYGGALALTPSELAPSESNCDTARFWNAFDRWCVGQGIVSEFIRNSLDEKSLVVGPGPTVYDRVNYVVDLTRSPDHLWRSFEHKVRKNVATARRSGVVVSFDTNGDRISEFMDIYRATMFRRHATESYWFPAEFFETIASSLRGNYVAVFSEHRGVPVSCELVLHDDRLAYSFLGGTHSEFFFLRPGDLLKFEVIRWLKEKGLEKFVLGGGASPGDGIERFKKSFAPHGEVDFRVTRRVHDPEVYDLLTRSHFAGAGLPYPCGEGPHFFPQYRADLSSCISAAAREPTAV
ncbi:MAG TPA: GNAT family N-acetyltransferase [Actinomycetaceae bacterium]|nr:GNAT family N-acetyltransferase [Actinomycetaceae bacterium]